MIGVAARTDQPRQVAQIARELRLPCPVAVDSPGATIGSSPFYIMAAEPRVCPHCSALLAPEGRFCGMCGKGVPANGHAVLDAVTFSAAVTRFREAFDYVIVDGPAVLAGGDVNLIQDACQAIVFATRSGESEMRHLKRAIEQVAPAQPAAVALMDA